MKILIAGIGNIFFGDDAFGVELAHRLMCLEWPVGIFIRDFGIRGLDLCYALTESYDACILLDAAPRGEAPGTLYSIEIDPAAIDSLTGDAVVDAHALHPLAVMQAVKAMGGTKTRVLLIGCQPDSPVAEE